MSEFHTVLVIDDSSTIRRLVDTTLSRDGYKVVLAATAEDGIEFAAEIRPEVILLDHQLPGTTGVEVCQHLNSDPELARVPVVISSTLRKRAYIEYAEASNVVDMLPKPYSEELLLTTIANALSTGAMVVTSQTQGTAVPEVVREQGEADLSGTFASFSIREVLDFLNNGRKKGTLEVEAGHNRYAIQLDKGRVQGITATGIPIDEIIARLPSSLSELAPVLKVTLGRGGSELDGIVDLLNTNVLDPRLLRKLLRHQAAVLLMKCFIEELKAFRFDSNRKAPPLYERLPLDVSALALLVEAALTADEQDIPDVDANSVFSRQPIRGQNLDRAGLSAHQTRILGKLTSPRPFAVLVQELDWSEEEVRRVLYGLEMAELVTCGRDEKTRSVIVFESELEVANRINAAFSTSNNYRVNVVQDPMAFKILAQRSTPDAVVVDTSGAESTRLLFTVKELLNADHIKWVVTRGSDSPDMTTLNVNGQLDRPYSVEELMAVLDTAFDSAAVAKSAADDKQQPSHKREEATPCMN